MPNALIHETSPYLLQHAHNPVNWEAWGDSAFERAKLENKPILLSIGYSTCHWCHVMERESFEDVSTAELMNNYFVCIKLDREERPDIDAIYMEVCQLISGGGGWPLNCFLLPDKRAFFAGTYFPPEPRYGRISWKQVLYNIYKAFHDTPEQVESQAQTVQTYLQDSNEAFIPKTDYFVQTVDNQQVFNPAYFLNLIENLRERFDREWGGFGGAPKFPSTFALAACLKYGHLYEDKDALLHVFHSLDNLCAGGIYDHLRGGWARYTVDAEWKIPHFEKMLYDNALIIKLLSDTYRLDPRPLYAERIRQTLDWVKAEMLAPKGGTYSALDADSEGVEGKFYTWDWSELAQILDANELETLSAYYQISPSGNWEHTNILYHPTDAPAKPTALAPIEAKLLAHRSQRIRPFLDDKQLWDWNALLATAYASAYKALGDAEYLQTAEALLDFCDQNHQHRYHSYKNGQAKIPAFLDDYAFAIEAHLETYTAGWNPEHLRTADALVQTVLQHFEDANDGLFFFTDATAQELTIRKKDLYDNATPSGNSVIISCLQRLAIWLNKPEYAQKAAHGLYTMRESIQKFPQSFGNWASAALEQAKAGREVVIIGKKYAEFAQNLQKYYLPNTIFQAAETEIAGFPLLQARRPANADQTLIYICENMACAAPVDSVEKALEVLGIG